MLSSDAIEKIRAIENLYPDKRSLVMSALWMVQRKSGGSLTREDLKDIAMLLDMNPVEVQAAATFYTMYHVVEPVGTYHIQVCRNISCWLLGAETIIEHLEKTFNIKTGAITDDQKYSLVTVECLGSCGTAPMMQINDYYYENLTLKNVDNIIKGLR
jgi:NADH-quinone oxidoreductase subunit E